MCVIMVINLAIKVIALLPIFTCVKSSNHTVQHLHHRPLHPYSLDIMGKAEEALNQVKARAMETIEELKQRWEELRE